MDEKAAKQAPGFVPRLLASASLVLYLALAWGSGMDRLSVSAPALERLVPGPVRAHADRSAAAIALSRSDAVSALVFASRAVRNDPVDPLSNSLLGSALQFGGDLQRAEAAFRVAAERGWRDRLTQLYWYDAALRTGDVERAALRADALLRADPQFAASVLLAPLEASAEGRAALARRLAGNPRWANAYLAVAGDVSTAQLRLKSGIALLAASEGGALDCETPRALVAALVGRGMRRDAERLWRAACGDDALAGMPQDGLTDGGFEQLAGEGNASPFGWRKHARGDVFIEAVKRGKGHALSLRNSASVSRLVLSQALGLPPGRYRVSADAGAAVGRIAISFDCGNAPRRPAQARGDVAAAGQTIEVGACDSQVLGVWLRPGSGELTLDDIAIERTN